jgi:hypothetical protein
MLIRFTRLTNDRHRFEIVRDDGTREAHDLETRSTLAHDLAHYAVELEAGLRHSFYGRLAGGTTYAELTTTPMQGAEPLQTERVVVMLQSTHKGVDQGPAELAAKIAAGFAGTADEPPSWLTAELLSRMIERLRRVQGQWRATPFHQTLELELPWLETAGLALR